MKYVEDWRVHEAEFDSIYIYSKPTIASAPDHVCVDYSPSEIFAMTYWLGYAATIGDDSYLKVAGGTLPPIPGLKRPPYTFGK